MIRREISLASIQKVLKTLPGHQEESIYDMLEHYIKKVMERHFQFGNNEKYGYPRPNPIYAKRKLKTYGLQPTLVASGKLKERVLVNYKIFKNRRNKWSIKFSIPSYGQYLIQKGFDFRNPSLLEEDELKIVYKEKLLERRLKMAKTLK